MRFLIPALFTLALSIAAAPALGSPPAAKTGAPPVIPDLTAWIGADGKPGPAAWQHAAGFSINNEISPGHNTPTPGNTRVEVGYTAKVLWLRFIVEDPHPADVRVRYREHDNINSNRDDFVGLFFSPFNDTQWSYELFCTSGGVEWDAFRQQNNEYSSFDAVWSCSAKKTPTGYEVIMKIPFGSIKFPHSDKPQVWRMLFFRNWPRNLRHQVANVQFDYNSNCTLCQAEVVHTATPITASPANFQLIPALTLMRTDTRNDPSGSLQHGSPKVEGSLDARWILSPDLEWAATVNPNFSQVAPDQLQLSVNRQFALYYPENRPFFEQGTQVFNTPGFLQGSDTFGTSGSLVDTRAIADPHWATKLVGQIGAGAIGVLAADDSTTNILLPGTQSSSIQSFGFNTKDALLRYRYDVGNSAIGVLATGRQGGGYNNGLYAFDASWQIDPSDTLTTLVGGSTTTYPTAVADALGIAPGTITGNAFTATFARSRRNYNFQVSTIHVANDFRADLGFLPQVGYDEGAVQGEYDFYAPNKNWYQNGGFGAFMNWTRTAGGGPILDRRVRLYAFEHGHYQTHFVFYATHDEQYFQGKTFALKQYEFDASAQPLNWLSGAINVVGGDGVDYVGVRKGGLLSISASLGFSPGRHLEISLVNNFERLNVVGERLYTANLYDLRVAWHFTSHLFVRAIAQEQDVRNNTALYPPGTPSRTRNLATQLIAGYQINPWTVFYAGVATGYMATGEYALLPQQRSYFLKASYYFQP
ncbi:MAG: DUF5916 domain-containing protein [Gammaproteobacteria bacterium]